MATGRFGGPLASEFAAFAATLEAGATANKTTLTQLRALDRFTAQRDLRVTRKVVLAGQRGVVNDLSLRGIGEWGVWRRRAALAVATVSRDHRAGGVAPRV